MNYSEYVNQVMDPDDFSGNEGRKDFIKQFEELRQHGISGVLQQATIMHKALRIFSAEDLDFCSNAVALDCLQRLDLAKLGERVERLREILGDRLESFALLHLVLQDRQVFQASLKSAVVVSDVHAVQLLDDILDSIKMERVGRPEGWTVDLYQTGFGYIEKEYPKYT